MGLYWIFILSFLINSVYSQTSCSVFDQGVDRPGPSYAHIRTTLSAEACCALCNAEGTRCQSWVFVQAGSYTPAPGCYLKQNIPSIDVSSTARQYCTSGFKQASLALDSRCVYPDGKFELAVDRPGQDYARLLSIQSHQACCTMCQTDGDKCRAWTFVRSGIPGKESGCFLKSQVPPISSTPCVPCTSGLK